MNKLFIYLPLNARALNFFKSIISHWRIVSNCPMLKEETKINLMFKIYLKFFHTFFDRLPWLRFFSPVCEMTSFPVRLNKKQE